MTNIENTEPYYADDEPEGSDTYDGPDGTIEDGTEGGYTAYPSIPAEQLEKMREQRPEFFRDNKIGEPVEYITTDAHMTEGLHKALIEKYGHIPELNEMVAVDEEPEDG